MTSKVLEANAAATKQMRRETGSRTLNRETGAAWAPPAPQAAPRQAPTPMQQFPFPMGPESYTPAERRAGQTTVNGQVVAPANSLSALSEGEYAARRQRETAAVGEFARDARASEADTAARERNRVQIDRRPGEEGGTIPGFAAHPFPMNSDVAPGDAGQRRNAAINLAARVTNTPSGYLRALAMQEGMNQADARNPRSTATGYMQFTEGTWLQMMREHGERYGLSPELRNSIQSRRGGGYYVSDASAREQIMALRADPEWSMIMGGELFQREAATIRRAVGRPVSVADVYMGHFLGGDLAGAVLRDIGRGRGNENAADYVRRYYARHRGQAEQVISQNPRQFAPNMTLASLYRMQVGDLIAHGERNGVPAAELRQVVQSPTVSNMTKASGGKQIMSAQEITQQANQRDWTVRQTPQDPNAARVDPTTGQVQLPTREQQRLQQEEQQRRDAEAVSRNRRSITIRRNGIRVTQPF